MNTIWLKIAGVIVAVVLIFVLVMVLTSPETEEPTQSEQPVKPENFAQQVEADKKKFLTEPQPVEEKAEETQQPVIEDQNLPEQVQVVQETKQEPQPETLYFKELNEIEKIEAERLLNTAVPGRSIGRLPMTGFKLMVDTSRQIIKKWPESWYAYRAKQLLAEMPERFKRRYNVTPEEMDLSMYAKPRAGTQPYTIKETR